MHTSGQAALTTLLVLTIAATIGLSLIARTTTDASAARRTEESSRAFSAAEAGIESALKSGVSGERTVNALTGERYAVTVAPVGSAASVPYIFPSKTSAGDTETIWLVSHAADGSLVETPMYTAPTIDLCWSSESVVPAVVVTLAYKESTDAINPYRVVKGAYDPDPAGTRRSMNKFSLPSASSDGCGVGTGTTYRKTILFSDLSGTINPSLDTLLFIRIRPVYSDTRIGAVPAVALPVQGNTITSVGKTASGVARKINVYRPYTSPGSVFDTAIYSEGSFTTQ